MLMFENLDIENIITPVKVGNLEQLLKETGFNKIRSQRLIHGFKYGFEIGLKGNRKVNRLAPNLKINIGTKVDLWNKVMKEVQKKRYAGPFKDIPFEHFIQSPIGLVPKDQGKDTRLIFHLSYPRTGSSVNSETPKDICKVKYPDFSEAVRMCIAAGNGEVAYQGKSDMKSAFRNLPMAVKEFMLLIMKAENPIDGKTYYFVDKCLPFGASISCALFQEFSDAVAHIFKKKSGKDTVNYLDDYYFAALLKSLCDGQIRIFLDICDYINFPISMEKTVWGCTVIVFLGFLIDAINQVIAIPVEKVNRAKEIIRNVLTKKSKKLTLHELQKICGFLNHLCRAIIPGRAFTRRLYAYTSGKLLPHHHININREMRQDLNMWLRFLETPLVYSRPFMDYENIWSPEELDWYTDASKNHNLGFGGIYGEAWFAKKWTDEDDVGNFIKDKDPSIQYLELYAVIASVLLWINKVQNKRIKLYCDNKSAVDMINTLMKEESQRLSHEINVDLQSLRLHYEHPDSNDYDVREALDALNTFMRRTKDAELIDLNKKFTAIHAAPVSSIWARLPESTRLPPGAIKTFRQDITPAPTYPAQNYQDFRGTGRGGRRPSRGRGPSRGPRGRGINRGRPYQQPRNQDRQQTIQKVVNLLSNIM